MKARSLLGRHYGATAALSADKDCWFAFPFPRGLNPDRTPGARPAARRSPRRHTTFTLYATTLTAKCPCDCLASHFSHIRQKLQYEMSNALENPRRGGRGFITTRAWVHNGCLGPPGIRSRQVSYGQRDILFHSPTKGTSSASKSYWYLTFFCPAASQPKGSSFLIHYFLQFQPLFSSAESRTCTCAKAVRCLPKFRTSIDTFL